MVVSAPSYQTEVKPVRAHHQPIQMSSDELEYEHSFWDPGNDHVRVNSVEPEGSLVGALNGPNIPLPLSDLR